jgi:flagellar biosynthesis protein FlhF
LITKLDETKYRGSILNLSWYSQKPLAYVTTGQTVPDDIEIVNVEAIANQILGDCRGDGPCPGDKNIYLRERVYG